MTDYGSGLPAHLIASRKTWSEKHAEQLVPIYIGTGVFLAVFILGPVLVTVLRFYEAGIYRTSIMLTSVSYYIFWVTVYISQLNPLLGPRYSNETLAWISRTWGRKIE